MVLVQRNLATTNTSLFRASIIRFEEITEILNVLVHFFNFFFQKFYLVNPYLVGYVLTLLVPRWLWTVFKTFIHFLLPTSWQGHVKHHTRTLILISAGLAYAACATLITLEETVQQEGFSLEFSHLRYCYLFYPAFLAFVYHTDMGHYLDLIPDSTPQHVRPEREKVEVEHQCSSDPVKVRREVEHLRNDFNVRLQNVLLHSYNTALGCALFPCCFVQVSSLDGSFDRAELKIFPSLNVP